MNIPKLQTASEFNNTENPEQMNTFSLIQQRVNDLKQDANAFYKKGNKAAGTRLRAGLLEIRRLCQDGRNDVTAKKNKISKI